MPTDECETPTALERIAKCVSGRGGWDAERGQLRLPSCFRLLMGDVCGGSSTPSMVRKVSRWKQKRIHRAFARVYLTGWQWWAKMLCTPR